MENIGKSPSLMGKSPIMAIFNSYVKLPEGICVIFRGWNHQPKHEDFTISLGKYGKMIRSMVIYWDLSWKMMKFMVLWWDFQWKNDEIAGNSIWISTRNTGGKCDFMCLNGTWLGFFCV
jgi:hypothetical protein